MPTFFQLYCTGFYSGRQRVIMWMALGVVTIRATPQKALQSLFNGVSMHFSKVFFWGYADRFLLLFSKSQLFQTHLGIVHTKQSCTSTTVGGTSSGSPNTSVLYSPKWLNFFQSQFFKMFAHAKSQLPITCTCRVIE